MLVNQEKLEVAFNEFVKYFASEKDEVFKTFKKSDFLNHPEKGLCCTNQICSKPPQPQNSFML